MSLNLIVTQMPLVSEISSALQSHPEVQQAIAQTHAVEAHKHEREQVQKTDKKEASHAIDPKARNSGDGRHLAHRRPHTSKQKKTEEDQHESPWAGNIIDVKI